MNVDADDIRLFRVSVETIAGEDHGTWSVWGENQWMVANYIVLENNEIITNVVDVESND